MFQEIQQYLKPTQVINGDHPAVADFARQHSFDLSDPREQAISLYTAVRDQIRYDPYCSEVSVEGLRASTTLSAGRGNCIAKAALLAACCRKAGIPARVGYADVRNHMTTARMRQYVEDGIFYWHGYTAIYLDDVWLKATPAFDIKLCRSFGIRPLDFDGYSDALFHPFDLKGEKHMEYIHYRGEFADVPVDRIGETYNQKYRLRQSAKDADFQREIEQEISKSLID